MKKKLETDRRHIQARIYEIEKELKEVEKNRSIQRAKRIKAGVPIVAIVGYTNVGKSTIVNELIKLSADYSKDKEVFVKDMLFATLGTHLRKATLPNGNEYLITDTIGFVSRLPHALVKAFKSTLEEIQFADLLLHVADASDPNYNLLTKTTENVLQELNVFEKPILLVNNKMDLVDTFENAPGDNYINISARNTNDIHRLLNRISEYLLQNHREATLFFPYEHASIVSDLHQKYSEIITEYENDGIKVQLYISKEDEMRYRLFLLS